MVPFTPRLIPAILPNLAHHVPMIQSAAIRTNKLLLAVIQKLPSPQEPSQLKTVADKAISGTDKPNQAKVPRSPTPTTTATTSSRQSTLSSQMSTKDSPLPDSAADSQSQNVPRTRVNADPSMTPRQAPPAEIPTASSSNSSRPHSPVSSASLPVAASIVNGQQIEESDPFDYQATVNELTVQFLSEFEETRVAALKWLIMLHQKAPKKVCEFFPVSFPGL